MCGRMCGRNFKIVRVHSLNNATQLNTLQERLGLYTQNCQLKTGFSNNKLVLPSRKWDSQLRIGIAKKELGSPIRNWHLQFETGISSFKMALPVLNEILLELRKNGAKTAKLKQC